MITCKRCSLSKLEDDFHFKRKGGQERRSVCKQCTLSRNNAWYAEWSKTNKKKLPDKLTLRLQGIAFRRSFNGRLYRMYYNMHFRVKHRESYAGKGCTINDFEQFKKFCMENNFSQVYQDWVNNGYIRKFTPTVDRIDPSRGYSWDNIQIVSFDENMKRRFA